MDVLTGPEVETAAVVKANAYGLGLSKIAPVLQKAGARVFFVALAEEGAELRRILGPKPKIFVFSGLMAGDAPLFRDHNLTPLINSVAQFARLRTELPSCDYGLQLDSGMNRLGLKIDDISQIADPLQETPPRLIISHLACADTPKHRQNQFQRDVFQSMNAILPDCPMSLAATGGILLGPDYHFQLVRPGIGLFGGLPFGDAAPVVTLDLPVIQTRIAERGEAVGYGATWIAERQTKIATLSAGYADGLVRAIGSPARVFDGSTPCPIVGRVSMDLIGVDVTALHETPGHLQILGPYQTIDDLAATAGTIGYEILTSLGARYERVYKGG